jgi:hypothetical protein
MKDVLPAPHSEIQRRITEHATKLRQTRVGAARSETSESRSLVLDCCTEMPLFQIPPKGKMVRRLSSTSARAKYAYAHAATGERK